MKRGLQPLLLRPEIFKCNDRTPWTETSRTLSPMNPVPGMGDVGEYVYIWSRTF
jgi:hypothetical protein